MSSRPIAHKFVSANDACICCKKYGVSLLIVTIYSITGTVCDECFYAPITKRCPKCNWKGCKYGCGQ